LKFKNPRKNSGRQPLHGAFKSRRLRVGINCDKSKHHFAPKLYHFLLNVIFVSLPQYRHTSTLKTLRTSDTDLRFYITTVQDG